jgi:hypothetical protein
MINELKSVRQNYLAITVAAIANFLFEAVWYSYFYQAWLDGIGRTQQFIDQSGVSLPLQFTTALLASAVIAGAISCVVQLTGEQTALRGIRVAVLLWLGFVLTTWATEYAFEVRTYKLFAINTGFWLLGMMLMGAIVGAWRKKP